MSLKRRQALANNSVTAYAAPSINENSTGGLSKKQNQLHNSQNNVICKYHIKLNKILQCMEEIENKTKKNGKKNGKKNLDIKPY